MNRTELSAQMPLDVAFRRPQTMLRRAHTRAYIDDAAATTAADEIVIRAPRNEYEAALKRLMTGESRT